MGRGDEQRNLSEDFPAFQAKNVAYKTPLLYSIAKPRKPHSYDDTTSPMPAVAQKNIRLDQPIDENAPPTIYTTSLKPELANAALNLTIDFQRQKQSGANRHIFKHPISIVTILVAALSFGFWKIGWIYQKGGVALLKKSPEELFPVFIFLSMFASIFFTLVTKPTEVIKSNADALVDSNERIFGFELKDLAQVNNEKKKKEKDDLLKKSENSSIVVYRDSPIALISIVEVPELFNGETFVVKITGVGVRKVYYKSGIIDDLFDWVQYRSVALNNGKFKKLLILIEVLSTDSELKKLLKSKQFQFIEKRPINDSQLLKAYGITNEIWGLPLNLSKLDKINSKVGATGVSK